MPEKVCDTASTLRKRGFHRKPRASRKSPTTKEETQKLRRENLDEVHRDLEEALGSRMQKRQEGGIDDEQLGSYSATATTKEFRDARRNFFKNVGLRERRDASSSEDEYASDRGDIRDGFEWIEDPWESESEENGHELGRMQAQAKVMLQTHLQLLKKYGKALIFGDKSRHRKLKMA
ncbi:hypothetical protein PVAG01_09130 [Phlyctema vagabunda]|uniref:Uncharacterized protein n=1 Tax=Phlyctema vagabunda TaxID=108571 RepID=A0ABR4P6H0_9HELO